jgi:hypothetical protein
MTTPRDQLYFDIFVTACEGGINYWAQRDSYHIWLDVDAGTEDVLGFYADVNETDDGEEMTARHRIDRQTIIRGYNRATSKEWRDKIRWSTEAPPLFVDDDTDWDFDAGDADTIVQLGLDLIDTIRSTGRQCVRYG